MKTDWYFFKNKRVLITGHTGFKGSWMSELLLEMGAEVTGYALKPPTNPSLFDLCRLQERLQSVTGDIRDIQTLESVFVQTQPEIVIHMAAQPLVRQSYEDPAGTYETNVMGTVNVLECVRKTNSVRSFINVTTDKVYRNREWEWGYRENEELNGYDPYSNSKSCSELVTETYKNCFFNQEKVAISTCRAGNVIGGGDYAKDRIIPDCIRAVEGKEDIIVRNPHSIRPYQHVLEPVSAYLMIAAAQYNDLTLAGNYNIGPDEKDCWTTGRLVTEFCSEWNNQTGENAKWINRYDGGPHEANFLKLDCSRIKNVFGWNPVWNVRQAIRKIIEFSMVDFRQPQALRNCMEQQIGEYLKDFADKDKGISNE